MDKNTAKLVMDDIETAIASVLEKHQLARKTIRGSYGEGDLRVTLTLVSTQPDQDPARLAWKRYASYFGLPEDALDRTFMARGEEWRIIGLEPSRRKFPVLVENAASGKRMLYVAADVARLLAADPTPYRPKPSDSATEYARSIGAVVEDVPA